MDKTCIINILFPVCREGRPMNPRLTVLLCPGAKHLTHIASYNCKWMLAGGRRDRLEQIGSQASNS